MKKVVLLLVIALLVLSFFFFDAHHYLTLENIKQSQGDIAKWQSQSPLLIALGFFVIYVAVTALSLPGAAVMTLAAGAFFGLLWGMLIVSFASTIGASLAFLMSRFVLRDSVQSKFAERLSTVNKGFEEEGAFYLFTLRLVPAFPFFLINLLMGLSKIRLWTFYWVSQVGMLAGTFVYVNAGTQLAQIDSLSGILSAKLILSFALLGIFPLTAKKLLAFIKKRQHANKITKVANEEQSHG